MNELMKSLQASGVTKSEEDVRAFLASVKINPDSITPAQISQVVSEFAPKAITTAAKPQQTTGKKAKKQHVNHAEQGQELANSLAVKDQQIVNTGIASGAGDANKFQAGYQTGFIHQHQRNIETNTTVISQQLGQIDSQSWETLVIDPVAVLGDSDSPKLITPVEDLDLYQQPAGLGFFS
jgi:hypothetical protein